MAVSFGVVLILNMIFYCGRHATLRVMGFWSFHLSLYFLFLSLYLTGSWQPSLLTGQMSLDGHTLHPGSSFYSGDGFAFSHTLFRRLPSTDGKILAIRPWINAKDHEVAYLIIFNTGVLFFVFSCLRSPFRRHT